MAVLIVHTRGGPMSKTSRRIRQPQQTSARMKKAKGADMDLRMACVWGVVFIVTLIELALIFDYAPN
jgi:hypothetical protein